MSVAPAASPRAAAAIAVLVLTLLVAFAAPGADAQMTGDLPVTSTARKPLSIAFEEIDGDKIGYERFDPEERARLEAEAAAAEAEGAVLGVVPDDE